MRVGLMYLVVAGLKSFGRPLKSRGNADDGRERLGRSLHSDGLRADRGGCGE